MGSAGLAGGAAVEATRAEPGIAEARHTTASFGLWPWVELARRKGMPLQEFCDDADVSLNALRDSGTRFSQAAADRVAAVAFEHFGADAAMAAALTVEAGQFSLLELLARTAPTVAHGLAQGCRFFPLLHDGGQLRHEARDAGAHALRWYPPRDYRVHHGYIELTFAVALRGIQRETGKDSLRPAEVWFTHAAPPDRTLFQRVLGKSVRFEMPYDQLVLSAAAGRLPLSRKNKEIHEVAADLARDLLAQR